MCSPRQAVLVPKSVAPFSASAGIWTVDNTNSDSYNFKTIALSRLKVLGAQTVEELLRARGPWPGGSGLSVLDLLHLGSSLSVRSFGRLGSTMSRRAHGTICY